MLDEPPRAADAVALDEVGREARAPSGRRGRTGRRSGCSRRRCGRERSPTGAISSALDAEREHVLDVAPLALEIGLGVREDDVVPRAPGHVLGAVDDQREERVRDVGDDQADRAGLASDQTLGESVRDVAELGDRLLDPAPRLGADARARVDDARHRHRRDPRQPRDVLNRDSHGSSLHRSRGTHTTIGLVHRQGSRPRDDYKTPAEGARAP